MRLTFWSLLLVGILSNASVFADSSQSKAMYEVTITNITHGEIFTPIMVASHKAGIRLFKTGEPASTELEILAESGSTAALTESLNAQGALDVVTSADVLPPGQSVTLLVKRSHKQDHISVASMLVPSNDAFFAVNGIQGPRRNGHTRIVMSPAYDAGSENNDELCANIPGPPFICTGEGYNETTGEGYVFIHPGIFGVGDLVPADHDWKNPVAKIVIRAVK